ncbi:hypothetical protein [Kineococcus terrestris]|uniref:hypothetical protein n=1 Tax=Kineococcus terrestris TaxID=2044856 RepID=UPI0034DB0FB5
MYPKKALIVMGVGAVVVGLLTIALSIGLWTNGNRNAWIPIVVILGVCAVMATALAYRVRKDRS